LNSDGNEPSDSYKQLISVWGSYIGARNNLFDSYLVYHTFLIMEIDSEEVKKIALLLLVVFKTSLLKLSPLQRSFS